MLHASQTAAFEGEQTDTVRPKVRRYNEFSRRMKRHRMGMRARLLLGIRAATYLFKHLSYRSNFPVTLNRQNVVSPTAKNCDHHVSTIGRNS
jgi:hypothetical protein